MAEPATEPASPDDRLSEERRLLRDAVRRFVRRELWLWEKRIDANAFALPPEVAADLRPKAAAMGLALLRKEGFRIALITGEDTEIVLRRADTFGQTRDRHADIR